METIYILDASGYLYRSYFAIRNITNAKGESTNALFGFIRSVQKLFKDFHPKHFVSVFDGPKGAKKRLEIYPEYKAHRQAMPPDLRYQIEWAKQFCDLMGLAQLSIPEVEADDTMGTVAKWAESMGSKVYLCTSDKDMCQVVNDHIHLLNTHKENLILDPAKVEEIHGVPPDKIIDLLAIIGDSSDNVPGIAGFGPKTAVELLKQFGSLDNLLAHPEKVKGEKKQETLKAEAELARLSRRLVTLDLSVEIPVEPDFYLIKHPQAQKLKDFYTSMNFNSLIKELEQAIQAVEQSSETPKAPEPQEEVSYTFVDDEASFQELLKTLAQQKEIGICTKTTHTQPIKAELIGLGFSFQPTQAWFVPVNGKLGLQRVLEGLKPLFENPSIGFFGHNVKYDYQVLANYGIKIATLSFDILLASYILNSHSRQHSLDALSLENFGKVKSSISDLTGKGAKMTPLHEVPCDQVTPFCCEDVDYIVRLKILLENALKERKLMALFRDLELPLLKVLAKMERHGIYLDLPCLELQGIEVNKQIKSLTQEIYALAGEEFNINSPKQLSEILFTKLGIRPPKKTATGHSTNADVLEFLGPSYPIAGKLIEYRTLEKLRSTYIESLPLEVYPKTHRIHGTFNQSVAATGRLSSQDPNLQNIPIRSEVGRNIRQAFRPEKSGWSYLAGDYSQIELRLLAHFSEDPTMLEAFNNNQDIHTHTAANIFNVPIGEVTKALRERAKAVNFGIIYGQGPFGLSQSLGISMTEAATFIDQYFKRYTRVRDFIESVKEKARQTGKAITQFGRERAIPEINSKNGQLRAAAERLAINTPLQGTAADMIKLAMLTIDKHLDKERLLSYMILQIHDELIFEVPDFEIMTLETVVRKDMQGVVKLKIPLIVDISIGKNWKEC